MLSHRFELGYRPALDGVRGLAWEVAAPLAATSQATPPANRPAGGSSPVTPPATSGD
jgi:hypothetical protein